MLEIFSSGNEAIVFGNLLGAKSAERAPEWVAEHHVSEKFGTPIDVSRRENAPLRIALRLKLLRPPDPGIVTTTPSHRSVDDGFVCCGNDASLPQHNKQMTRSVRALRSLAIGVSQRDSFVELIDGQEQSET